MSVQSIEKTHKPLKNSCFGTKVNHRVALDLQTETHMLFDSFTDDHFTRRSRIANYGNLTFGSGPRQNNFQNLDRQFECEGLGDASATSLKLSGMI